MIKLTVKYLFSHPELKEIKQGYFRLSETNKENKHFLPTQHR